MEDFQQNRIEEDAVTLKSLILKIQEFYFEVLKYWKIVAFVVTFFVFYYGIKTFFIPNTYSAELSFMINEGEGGRMGGAMSILNQFGLGGTNNEYNLEKIVDLSKTQKICNFVFFEKITVNGKVDFIANHFIELYKLRDNWDKDSPLHEFKFTSGNFFDFSRVENLALRILHGIVIGKKGKLGLYTTEINDKTGIMYLSMNSRSEELSIKWVELVFQYLSKYYIDKTIEKENFTYDIVKLKADSIKALLYQSELNLANFKDSNRGLWTKKTSLKEQRLSRDIKMLTLMYGEALKNLEIADISRKSKRPLIQLIDSPFAPLSPNKASILKSVLTGGMLGFLITVGVILARKVYMNSMNEETKR